MFFLLSKLGATHTQRNQAARQQGEQARRAAEVAAAETRDSVIASGNEGETEPHPTKVVGEGGVVAAAAAEALPAKVNPSGSSVVRTPNRAHGEVAIETTLRLTNNDMKDFSCMICTELLLDPATAPCGHSFCTQCLAKWRESCRTGGAVPCTCPECRKPLPHTLRPSVQLTEIMVSGPSLSVSPRFIFGLVSILGFDANSRGCPTQHLLLRHACLFFGFCSVGDCVFVADGLAASCPVPFP
jgi:hypothetical protein